MTYMSIKFEDGTTEEYDSEPLSSGAQGAIFPSRDQKHLVKLYFPRPGVSDVERAQRILTLIHDLNPTKDAPYWEQYFAWPEKLVIEPRVGFRMRWARGLNTYDRFIFPTFYEKILKPHERGWFPGRVAAAIKMANAANRLSSSGFCYPDFSHRNILVDAFDGEMVLIDCDSMTVPGRLPAEVQGTSFFRAPELVSGDLSIPNVRSDRHSLAVILYLWLLRWHPLLGDKIHSSDPNLDEELRFGKEALYIEHPTDFSNRARGQKYTSRLLGRDWYDLFKRAFVEGLHTPSLRPQPNEWQHALWRLADRIVPCANPACDWRGLVGTPTRGLACPCCGQRVQQPQNLPFVYLMRHRGDRDPDHYNLDLTAAHYVVGWPGRTLHAWHEKPSDSPLPKDPTHMPDISTKAVFDYDPRKDQWHLINVAMPNARINATGVAGDWQSWPVNAPLTLRSGMLIQFAPASDYFRARVEIMPIV